MKIENVTKKEQKQTDHAKEAGRIREEQIAKALIKTLRIKKARG